MTVRNTPTTMKKKKKSQKEHAAGLPPRVEDQVVVPILLEPSWPTGLGLWRGGQAIMDTHYAADYLYNRTRFCKRRGMNEDTFSWDDRWEALAEQAMNNFVFCNRVQVAKEWGQGDYGVTNLVIKQWKEMQYGGGKPVLLVEVDPWSPLESAMKMNWLRLDDPKWLHPVLKGHLGITAYNVEAKKKGGKRN